MDYSNISNQELITLFRSIMSEISLRDLETLHDAQEAMKQELLKKEEMKKIITKTEEETAAGCYLDDTTHDKDLV